MRHKLETEAGGEKFIFFYDCDDHSEMLRVLGRCASDPMSRFTWLNAARLSEEVRNNLKKKYSTNRVAKIWK